MVLRDGQPVREQYWAPFVAEDRALMYSVSKTFTASAVALAVAEGRFGLDDRIVDLLPEAWATVSVQTEGVAQLTVHHVLSMSTGHDADVLEVFDHAAPQDWAKVFLSTPPQTPVGSRHVYNNGASWILGELIRRHTGEDLLNYLRPRLLEPLGIDATWDRDGLGRCFGWSGIHVRTRDLAAMGELYRCDGVWQGRRLLPDGYVARATTAQIPTIESFDDWCFGYGYQLWLGREGYRLDGAYGQFSLVLPDRGLVIAITSAQSCAQILLDLVWDVLLPELEAVPEEGAQPASSTVPEEGAQRPFRRAAVTSLPLPTDSGLGTDWSAPGPVPLDEGLVVSPDPQANLPALTDPHARRDGSGFRIGFTTDGQPVDLIAGCGEWVRQRVALGDVTIPVAAVAGAGADGALDVRLVFTESPHTLLLRLAGATAGLAWGTVPLQGGDLARMVAR